MSDTSESRKINSSVSLHLSGNRWPTETAIILSKIIDQQGSEIFRNIPQFEETLETSGVNPVEIKQISLIIQSSSILSYLHRIQDGLSGIDINNIIRSSVLGGLNETTARKRVPELLYALKVPVMLDEVLWRESLFSHNETGDAPPSSMLKDLQEGLKKNLSEKELSLYLPPYIYAETFDEIDMEIRSKGTLSDKQMSELYTLSKAGIGKAESYLGRFYYYGISVQKDIVIAEKYLRRAAGSGESAACGLLGDLLYEKGDLEDALYYYTRPGALGQNSDRLNRTKALYLARDKCKKSIVFYGLAIILLFICTFWFFPMFGTAVGFRTTKHILSRIIGFLIWTISSVIIGINLYEKPISTSSENRKILGICTILLLLVNIVL